MSGFDYGTRLDFRGYVNHEPDDLYALVQFEHAGHDPDWGPRRDAGHRARRAVRRVHGPFPDEATALAYAADAGISDDEASVTRLTVAIPPSPAGWTGAFPSPRRATP